MLRLVGGAIVLYLSLKGLAVVLDEELELRRLSHSSRN